MINHKIPDFVMVQTVEAHFQAWKISDMPWALFGYLLKPYKGIMVCLDVIEHESCEAFSFHVSVSEGFKKRFEFV